MKALNNKEDIYSKRLEDLRAKLGEAELVAVSKYSPPSDAEIYYQLGQFDFGENRVSELSLKANYFLERNLDDVRWHFIGNLQRNKVKQLLQIPKLHAIHSIDRNDLLDELIKHQEYFKGESLDLYFEMNLGGEVEKHGFLDINTLAKTIEHKKEKLPPRFKMKGLMAMAPIRTEEPMAQARKCFLDLKECARVLNERFGMELTLSMGMSNDYEIALECGSRIVRIGGLLFSM